MAKSSVALIVGVTGIVGSSLVETMQKPGAAGGPWKIHGIARRQKPEWFEDEAVDYIQCDLTSRDETLAKLSKLQAVSHVFWATWIKRSNEEEDCEANGLMMDNLLEAIVPAARNLQHICLTTGVKHYLGPHSRFGSVQHHKPPFHEELPRITDYPNFYYVLEDKVFAACSSRQGLTWSVHRPNVIFGFAPRNYASVLGSIIVYGTICKQQGRKFDFPGDKRAWECEVNISDADGIAEQELWAATDGPKNEAFNAANGDMVTWKQLWEVLCRELNVEAAEYSGRSFSLVEMMEREEQQECWKQIAAENSLVVEELHPGQFWAVDLCLNVPFQLVTSLEKCRLHGFVPCGDTCGSVVRWINKMKRKRVIPASSEFWN